MKYARPRTNFIGFYTRSQAKLIKSLNTKGEA